MLHVNTAMTLLFFATASEYLGNNDRHVAWPCQVLQVLYVVLHLMSCVCCDCTLGAWIGSIVGLVLELELAVSYLTVSVSCNVQWSAAWVGACSNPSEQCKSISSL